jgi:sialate O-acetylesterase
MNKLLFLLFFQFFAFTTSATITLPRIFSDHMVIQRNKPVRIWGWAAPGERITIKMAYATIKVKATRNGKFEGFLPAMPAGGPYTLTVSGSNVIRIDDILAGEIWVCSGQSNMEWPLSNTLNADKEINQANYPLIRHFKVPLKTAFNPKETLDGGQWEICTPATAANFTAVGYYFAKEILRELNVPVGLVNSSWGGTDIETWISNDAFFNEKTFAPLKSRMPANADSIVIIQKNRIEALVRQTQGALPSITEELQFKSPDYNDATWKTMQLPRIWENAGLPELDGVVWFRKSFIIEGEPAPTATLSLGPIDDMDSTFINGIWIGSTSRYNEPRKYIIDKAALKIGNNVISVKVTDGGGGGGIYGKPEELFLQHGTKIISLANDWKYRIAQTQQNNAIGPNSYPTLLYNAMIHPLINFPIAGVLWYQGESNAGRAAEYRTAFPLMIRNWRSKWQDEFPFYFVQLANFSASGGTNQNGGSMWAELREAQASVLQLPKTGMAVTIDIGDSHDIHPRNKQDVGKRLAAIAMAQTYAKPRVYAGPTYKSMERQGSGITIHFNNAENGLVVKNKYGYVFGFEIAGEDQVFYFAQATIKGNQLFVFNPEVKQPIAVRYAWADDPSDANLYNHEGYPAAPFRTDNWKMKTESSKYSIR